MRPDRGNGFGFEPEGQRDTPKGVVLSRAPDRALLSFAPDRAMPFNVPVAMTMDYRPAIREGGNISQKPYFLRSGERRIRTLNTPWRGFTLPR